MPGYARVYNASNTTKLADLWQTGDHGFVWKPGELAAPETLNDITQLRMSVPADHPAVEHLRFPNVVRTYETFNAADDAPAASFVIGPRSETRVSPDGHGGLVVDLTGEHANSVLDRALVRGWVRDPTLEPQSDVKAFGCAAPAFPTAGLSTTLHVQTRATSTPQRPVADTDPYTAAVWPLPEAPSHPLGRAHIIRDFTLASDAEVVFFYTGDDEAAIWCDGVMLDAQRPQHPSDVWHYLWRAGVKLKAGTHRFKLDGYNYAASGPGMLRASAWETNGEVLGDPIFATGASPAAAPVGTWHVIAYPSEEPGMSLGAILRILITEAQADGALAGVTRDFTDAVDSAGRPWPIVSGYAPILDQSIWSATNPLRAGWCDIEVTAPGFTVRAWDRTTGPGKPGGAPVAVTSASGRLLSLTVHEQSAT